MTDAQKFKFYFPAWSAAVAANGWHVVHKHVIVDEDRLTEEGRKVLAFARQRAQARSQKSEVRSQTSGLRPPTSALSLDDVRHGAHVLALQRDKSSKDLTNAEMDRCVCLFNVLADPEFLGTKHKMGRLDWDAYQRGEDPGAMRRLHWIIESFPEALARHIAADMIGRRDWEFATIADKRTLARRIAQYKKSRRERSGASADRRQPKAENAALCRDAATDDPDWNV